MAREIKAYSICETIINFMNNVHGWKEAAEELKERIIVYANLLLDGDKDTLILLLQGEVDYDSFALDLLKMVYDF